MATATAPRTRTVEVKTTEEQPIESRWKPINATWQEFVAECSDPDTAAITEISLYRVEPAQHKGFLTKTSEPIDEAWIARNFGGGVYNIKIYRKPDFSHFERNVAVAGEPKIPQLAGTVPPASAANDALAKAMERQADMIERLLDRVQQQPAQQQPAPTAAQDSIVKMLSEASTEAIKLVAAQAKPAPAPEPPKENPLMQKILDVLVERAFAKPDKADSLDAELTRLEKLKTILQPAGAVTVAGGPLEQFETLGKIVGAIDKLRGEGGGAPMDWKTALVDKLADRLPDVAREVKEMFEANARTTEARARGAAAVAAARATAPPAAVPLPQAPRPAAAPGPPHVVPAPAPAAPSPEWAGPLDLAGATTQAEAAIPPEQIQEAQIVDKYLKTRIVQLVAENADPMMVLTLIDGMAPVISAILARSSEQDIRNFLTNDPQLVEITKLPHYESYLVELIEAIRRPPEDDETPPARPRPN